MYCKLLKCYIQQRIPEKDWHDYFAFLSSLAMNVDIDSLVSALSDPIEFIFKCDSEKCSADKRFASLFLHLPDFIEAGGPSSPFAKALKEEFYRDSLVISSQLPDIISKALINQGEKINMTDIELDVLNFFGEQKSGFPCISKMDTVFIANQSCYSVAEDNYVFWMDESDCSKFDLVEMGLCQGINNVMYGGININFFSMNDAPIKASFSMVHPAIANRMCDLIHGKTIILGFSVDLVTNNNLNYWGRLLSLVSDQHVILYFYNSFEKFIYWVENRRERLKYSLCELDYPPVRFFVLSEDGDDLRSYVLPVAPVENTTINLALHDVRQCSLSEILNSEEKLMDFNRFCKWFVFAPVK